MRWLEKEARGKQVFFLIAVCLIVKYIYTYAVLILFHFTHVELPPPSRDKIELTWHTPFWLLLFVVIEEIAFRLFPLIITIELNWSLSRILLVAVAISVIFGVLHGGALYIFVQGVFGFVYSLMFLKCGGLNGRYFKALATTTTTHFLWNGTLATLAYASGLTSF